MAEFELRNVDSSAAPLMRSLSKNNDFEGESVETDFGPVFVIKSGVPPNSGKPYIITYHDLGLNFFSNFQAFFNFDDMKILLQSFTVLNIHAPGQEENAAPLPEGYTFPTMDQLAQQVDSVCKFYGVVSFVGFGVGAGANVLSRYALNFPEMVDGLFLIHPTSTQCSWTEWFYQKVNLYYMGGVAQLANPGQTFPQSAQDYLMWHHFGRVTEERHLDLLNTYRRYFSGKSHNTRNLAMFIDSFLKRTDLAIERGNKERNFKCAVLVLCGALSPHVDDTVNMNGRLIPNNSTWMKLSDCGMVLEEQPSKVFEAFRLFLQGLGYALSAYERRRSLRQQSTTEESYEQLDLSNQKVHIVENPIAQC